MSAEPSAAMRDAGRVAIVQSESDSYREIAREVYLAMKALDPDFAHSPTKARPQEIEAVALKPCPFCEGEADEMVGVKNDHGFAVQCRRLYCRASTRGHPTRGQANAAWNTRAAMHRASSDDQGEVEFLRELAEAIADGEGDPQVMAQQTLQQIADRNSPQAEGETK